MLRITTVILVLLLASPAFSTSYYYKSSSIEPYLRTAKSYIIYTARLLKEYLPKIIEYSIKALKYAIHAAISIIGWTIDAVSDILSGL